MSNNDKKTVKYCVHCGAKIIGEQTYCPKCGKLILQLKPSREEKEVIKSHSEIISERNGEIVRKCPGCGSIITSTILEQCPICDAILEKIPKEKLQKAKTSGFIFTSKKLELEKSYEIQPGSWNIKEGLNIFANSILIYITVQLLLYMFLYIRFGNPETGVIEFNIFTIILSQIPAAIFGLFPIWYIYANNHNIEKLGFTKDYSKILLSVFIGLAGAFCLYGINILNTYINTFLAESGFSLFDIEDYIAEENKIIASADIQWLILLTILLILGSISVEIVFRGVVQNSLKDKFDDSIYGKINRIIIVALIYSIIFTVLYFPIGFVFFLMNFLGFIILGALYEINGNIYNTIFTGIFYNLLIILLIIL
ncbi:MAG: CPBP family glutamic-type intramembrane protease [Promethearchaeota archaeon]